jgi:hypothetical protein
MEEDVPEMSLKEARSAIIPEAPVMSMFNVME